MSAFKQSMRKLGIRAGLLAGTSAAVLAIAGIGAGSAMAAPTCPNSLEIHGKGSSLQKIAQLEVWNPGYNSICSSKPKVTYESTGSGPGLEAFGFTGSTPTVNHSFQYIGTDDGPNATEIASAETASGSKPVIVPVSQTAIAVVIHPPTNCKFKSGKGITYAELNEAFGGTAITNWDQFSNIEATVSGACNATIKRVVRKEGSGTTYQFKNYLQTLHEKESAEKLPCSTEGTEEWSGLEEVGSPPAEKPNTVWPECGTHTTVTPEAGGGAVAEYVASAEGVDSIGYAALPDAKAKSAQVALLQNGKPGGTPTYATPGEGGVAFCENDRYTVPAEGRTTGSGVAVDWSKVFGAQPEIGGEEYPLCTLTYDVGWKKYTTAGYSEEQGKDVFDYIKNYVVAPTEGQSALETAAKWYSAMPTTGGAGSATDVQSAAEYAAGKINEGV